MPSFFQMVFIRSPLQPWEKIRFLHTLQRKQTLRAGKCLPQVSHTHTHTQPGSGRAGFWTRSRIWCLCSALCQPRWDLLNQHCVPDDKWPRLRTSVNLQLVNLFLWPIHTPGFRCNWISGLPKQKPGPWPGEPASKPSALGSSPLHPEAGSQPLSPGHTAFQSSPATPRPAHVLLTHPSMPRILTISSN